ncbi:MAG: hypothetical protein N3H30_01150 [Candidatus Micrarchaeota archaeon]|nr:hypothetical protein [Candidatus Micrarchaeota archaeon]
MKNTCCKIGITHLIGVAAALSLIEGALILAGVITPLLNYSLGNIMFSLLVLCTVIYAGAISAREGLLESLKNGALVGGAAALVMALLALASHYTVRVPVLGISAPDSIAFYVLLLIIIAENSLLCAVVGLISGLAARAFQKPARAATRK